MSYQTNLATALDTPPQTLAAPRLLVVDDVADNRVVLTRRFERRGFEIVEAPGGREALELLGQEHFDLVLLDVMMPEMDGFAVLREIRRGRSASELPVIMVTAKSQSEDMVEALSLGANDYVTKPVDFPVALARVSAQVERCRAQRSAERDAAALRVELIERQRSEEQDRQIARRDILTGLGNRLMFRERLAECLAGGAHERLHCLLLDLDGFRSVNDGAGHATGDLLLIHAARRIEALAGLGGIVARLGGDEFGILLRDRDLAEAEGVAAALIGELGHAVTLGGRLVQCGASIGIATAAMAGAQPESVMRAADMALDCARCDGGNAIHRFDTTMDETARARRALELDLRNALQEGELALFYQPVVDIASGRIVSFEALMRWRHPERGYVSPAEFVPIAEDLGLIVPLGAWALREACREAAGWPSGIGVAVNLSPVQFTRGDLVAAVVSALAASGLPPERLELEITETAAMANPEQVRLVLERLRSLGVRVALDDFGTGYSSLGYLRSLAFDKIKIDRSFVRDLPGDADSHAIVRAITELAARFGAAVTAEGVETVGQRSLLTAEGCALAQGRLFSMPVPAEEALRLIAAGPTG